MSCQQCVHDSNGRAAVSRIAPRENVARSAADGGWRTAASTHLMRTSGQRLRPIV